jgi:hypothetical protein
VDADFLSAETKAGVSEPISIAFDFQIKVRNEDRSRFKPYKEHKIISVQLITPGKILKQVQNDVSIETNSR